MQKIKYKLVGIFLIITSISIAGSAAAYFVPPDGGGGENLVKKYAYFFWTSETCQTSVIDSYRLQLSNRGYDTYSYMNTNPISIRGTIDNREDANDKLFFYFIGHGFFEIQSYVEWSPDNYISSFSLFYSFTYYFESPDITILVEACQAGEFVARFYGDDEYTVITSSSSDEGAGWVSSPEKEGLFSEDFFYYLATHPSGTYYQSFTYAKNENAVQEPLMYYNGVIYY